MRARKLNSMKVNARNCVGIFFSMTNEHGSDDDETTREILRILLYSSPFIYFSYNLLPIKLSRAIY